MKAFSFVPFKAAFKAINVTKKDFRRETLFGHDGNLTRE